MNSEITTLKDITTKTKLRACALVVLYNFDLRYEDLRVFEEDELKDAVDFAIQEIFNKEIEKSRVEDVINIIEGVANNIGQINSIIIESLESYKIHRLSYVDRAIIRIATYELLNGVPKNIAINEAIDITKIFSEEGDGKARKFNNKLLDNISKKVGEVSVSE